MAGKLEAPKNISINFKPSPKQLVAWKALMPECPICGGKVEQTEYAKDKNGHALYKPKCTKCGNSNIPQTILCGGAAGGGKAICINSLVCTPYGFKPLKDLKIGDLISNPMTGCCQKILYIHPKGKFEFYRIDFSDGTSTECSEGHLWKCHIGPYDEGEIWETTMMYRWVKGNSDSDEHMYIPLTRPVQFLGESFLMIHPYTLGFILGNEDFGMNEFDDAEMKELEEWGIYHDGKIDPRIPDAYKYSKLSQRSSLIYGITMSRNCTSSEHTTVYKTRSREFAEDIAWVVRSLGNWAKIVEGDGYEVCFSSKWKSNWDDGVSSDFCDTHKYITNITPIGPQESFCISVSDPSGLYITDDFTVTHNSYLASCWLIYMCIRYEGVRLFVARTTLKSIRETTWKTIKDLLKEWKFIQDKHWKENTIFGYIEFWNGSTINMVELAPSNIDPEYQRLGSAEYTGGYIEEAGEVDEKGAEVLMSRIRYKVQETTVTQKCLLGSNPSLNWIKGRFVYDDEGNPVECAEGDLYVPFTVYDNPDDKFRMQYIQNLMRIKDVALRERLLNGNWLWIDANVAAAYWAFDGEKHLGIGVKDQYYDPLRPLVLSFDFNVLPYMSCLVLQFDYSAKKVYVLEEILGLPNEKTNNTPALAKKIARKYLTEGHLGGLVITGDPAGLARSTQTEAGINNFSIIMNELDAPQLHAVKKLLATQPPQIQRLEFVNSILEGRVEGWSVVIDMRCNRFKEDLIYQRKNQDGTKEKKKVTNTKLGAKYEKYGHLSDCFDYALCYFLAEQFTKFKRGTANQAVTTSPTYPVSDTFDW